MQPNALLVEDFKMVTGCPPAALATTAGDGDVVSLKNYDKVTMVLMVNNATTVTGGAVTLIQSTDVSGTGAKALGFDYVWANIDTDSTDTLVKTAVTSDTFTTDTTNDSNLLYVLEVNASDLDVDNGFDCVRIDVASMANAVGSVLYIMGTPRYAKGTPPTAITD